VGSLKWHGPTVQASIAAEIARRIKACCIIVANRAKVLLSVAGTGKEGRKRTYGTNPSAPGEPPRKQFGHLRRSVTYETAADGKSGRVGTNLPYGRWLELGTRLMKARPWLRRALGECEARVKAILTAPMKGP
jgi:HK97 gp10 family phage protein